MTGGEGARLVDAECDRATGVVCGAVAATRQAPAACGVAWGVVTQAGRGAACVAAGVGVAR